MSYTNWVRRGLSLEGGKFFVYLSVPVIFVAWFSNPRRIREYLGSYAFLIYPPEEKRQKINSLHELREFRQKLEDEDRAKALQNAMEQKQNS